MQYTGGTSVLNILVQVGFILMTLQALSSLQLAKLFKRPPQGLPLLIVMVAIALGSTCANFFLDCFTILQGALRMLN